MDFDLVPRQSPHWMYSDSNIAGKERDTGKDKRRASLIDPLSAYPLIIGVVENNGHFSFFPIEFSINKIVNDFQLIPNYEAVIMLIVRSYENQAFLWGWGVATGMENSNNPFL